MLTEAIKQQLLQAAVTAPSADNSQPWLYQWQNDNTLELWIDETRSGKASDATFFLSDLAIGSVLEAIVVKAAEQELDVSISYFPTNNPYLPCTIQFSQPVHSTSNNMPMPNAELHALATFLDQRQTDRRFPFKGMPTQTIMDEMSRAAQSLDCALNWFTESKSKNQAISLVAKAEALRFKSETLHQEIFSSINTDGTADEGMTYDDLEIEKPARPFFKLISKWRWMNRFNKIGGAKLIAQRSVSLPMKLSPALCQLTINPLHEEQHLDPNYSRRVNIINGGRAVLRTWLMATKHNLSVHPYAAPGVVALDVVQLSDEDIQQEMTNVRSEINAFTKNGRTLMFFRVGFYDQPLAHHSKRRSIASFQK
ncbi:nitroreductase family protein [Flocculibacter collagenilyticus]|uniref:hypothetical protein n=1 Tax=Flocculibacter collagenilyticus TaxID=2744479 RepID=UPI0018F572A6|nr:hypothetical protein [Flocculibacter collagenilyticus]